MHNALIEALTVHARILTEFVFHGRDKADDAIADDFVPDWHKKRPRLPAVLKPLNSRVGKEIVHLSFGRLVHKTDFEKRWPSGEIVDELVHVINLWAALAPDYIRQAVMAQTREVNDFIANRLAPPASGSSE